MKPWAILCARGRRADTIVFGTEAMMVGFRRKRVKFWLQKAFYDSRAEKGKYPNQLMY